jgi:hypothetical protein
LVGHEVDRLCAIVPNPGLDEERLAGGAQMNLQREAVTLRGQGEDRRGRRGSGAAHEQARADHDARQADDQSHGSLPCPNRAAASYPMVRRG